MSTTLDLLRSVRFNIGLIVALILLFALGTIIPQENDAPQKVAAFLKSHAFFGPLLAKTGLFHIYHTPLVMGMLGLLALDIWVCRVWPRLKGLRKGMTKEKWGSLINHIGLVVVLAGCLIKVLWGFEEFLMITPGQDKEIKRFPASTVSLFDFKVDFYPGTKTPRLFESDLRVAAGNVIKERKLRVNEPLSLNILPLAPVRLYQASWGATGMFKNATLALGPNQSVTLKMDESVSIPRTPFTVTGKSLLPDFTAAAGRPDTKSLELNEPALSVIFEQGGTQTRPLWLLLNRPQIAFEELSDGTLRPAPPPPFKLTSIDPVFFSGIQVAYDPGFPILISGVILMLTGFFLYMTAKWTQLN